MPKKKKTNKNHLVVHNEYPKPFQCQICDSKFRFPSLLNRHIAQMHDGENGDTTDLQPTQYNDINQIEGFDLLTTQTPINYDQTIKKEENSMPMDPNTGKPIFSCNLCDFTTHTRKCLKSHLKSNDFCCNDCGEKFHGKSGRQDIKIHWKMYHSETTKIYKKPKKDEGSFWFEDTEEIRYEFPCSLCSFMSEDQNEFKFHLESVHPANNSGEVFECLKCDFKNLEIRKINAHLKTHRHYQCLGCENKFFGSESKILFGQHLKRVKEDQGNLLGGIDNC